MANLTGVSPSNRPQETPWTTERGLIIGNETFTTDTTIYLRQAVGRDVSGLLVQMDDTAKAEFIGFVTSPFTNQVIDSGDAANDKKYTVSQPQMFTAKIASAAAGDEGKRVYWLYNNEVAYTPGSNGNFAGWVQKVEGSTQVAVLPPWMGAVTDGNNKGLLSLGVGSGTVTLTKHDVNKDFTGTPTATVTVKLPVSTKCSPGDKMEFINLGSDTFTINFAVQSTDSINLGTTAISSATTQFGRTVVETDAALNWYAKTY